VVRVQQDHLVAVVEAELAVVEAVLLRLIILILLAGLAEVM
jgi:hypothetical protein